jgi:hypothetical protein
MSEIAPLKLAIVSSSASVLSLITTSIAYSLFPDRRVTIEIVSEYLLNSFVYNPAMLGLITNKKLDYQLFFGPVASQRRYFSFMSVPLVYQLKNITMKKLLPILSKRIKNDFVAITLNNIIFNVSSFFVFTLYGEALIEEDEEVPRQKYTELALAACIFTLSAFALGIKQLE